MTDEELDAFLTEQRVVRLATIDDEGWPAVVPLWFVWHAGAIWVWNLTRAKRTRRLEQGTRCAFTVDGGHEYVELQGVSGRLEYAFVDDAEVPSEVRLTMARTYFHSDEPIPPADHHAWIRFEPTTLRSWDFHKL